MAKDWKDEFKELKEKWMPSIFQRMGDNRKDADVPVFGFKDKDPQEQFGTYTKREWERLKVEHGDKYPLFMVSMRLKDGHLPKTREEPFRYAEDRYYMVEETYCGFHVVDGSVIAAFINPDDTVVVTRAMIGTDAYDIAIGVRTL